MAPCSSVSWLHQPNFVLHFSHFSAFIIFPLHFLGAFCILQRTPSTMTSAKFALLAHHLWNTLVDCLLILFVVPCPLFPTISGYTLGYFNAMGISVTFQAWLLTTAYSFVCVSVTAIFENRFYLLIAKHTKWSAWRPFWMVANSVFCLVYIIPTMAQLPDQKTAKAAVLNSLPCVPEFLVTAEMIVSTLDANFFVYSILVFNIVVFGQLTIFAIILTVKLSTNFGASTLSNYTRRLQRNLLKALVLQTGIPFVYLLLPTALAFFVIFTNYFDLATNHLIVVVTSLHGFVSTSSMILTHSPYRKTVVAGFRRTAPHAVTHFPIFAKQDQLPAG